MKLLDHFTVYSCIGCGSVLKGRNVLCDECRIKLKAETRCAAPTARRLTMPAPARLRADCLPMRFTWPLIWSTA